MMKNHPQKKIIGSFGKVSLLYFLEKVIAPTITTFLAFLVFLFAYQTISGIHRTKFSQQQLHSIIQEYLGDARADYDLYKADFHGFGVESYVVVSRDQSQIDSNKPKTQPKLIVFDQIQPNPLEQFLFSEKLYQASFVMTLVPEKEYDQDFENMEFIKYKNFRKRLAFCIGMFDKKCGFLQYNNGEYEVVSFADDLTELCTKSALVNTVERGSVKLAQLPSDSRLYFRSEDREAYIAAPVYSRKKPNYQAYGDNESKGQFAICKYTGMIGIENFSLYNYQSALWCYVSKGKFYESEFPNYHFVTEEQRLASEKELEKEVDRNVGVPFNEWNNYSEMCDDAILPN